MQVQQGFPRITALFLKQLNAPVSHVYWSQFTLPLKPQLQPLLFWTAFNLFCPSGLLRHYLASHLSEVQSWALFHSPVQLPCSRMVSVTFLFTPMSSMLQDGVAQDGL